MSNKNFAKDIVAALSVLSGLGVGGVNAAVEKKDDKNVASQTTKTVAAAKTGGFDLKSAAIASPLMALFGAGVTFGGLKFAGKLGGSGSGAGLEKDDKGAIAVNNVKILAALLPKIAGYGNNDDEKAKLKAKVTNGREAVLVAVVNNSTIKELGASANDPDVNLTGNNASWLKTGKFINPAKLAGTDKAKDYMLASGAGQAVIDGDGGLADAKKIDFGSVQPAAPDNLDGANAQVAVNRLLCRMVLGNVLGKDQVNAFTGSGLIVEWKGINNNVVELEATMNNKKTTLKLDVTKIGEADAYNFTESAVS